MNLDPTQRSLAEAPLGKKSSYINQYAPDLLFPIARKIKRDEIQMPEKLPFQGYDIWNAFEVSWLNLKGKPVVARAEFKIPCQSPCIIESKSFKLYLNSFNNSQFESFDQVVALMRTDLTRASRADVDVQLLPVNADVPSASQLNGVCLDGLDIECDRYQPDPTLLTVGSDGSEETLIEETLTSDLLKSNCLVTGQPDWGSIQIRYRGPKINREGLLKYIVSLRDHQEFHEQCIERIFLDITRQCRPERLSVYARYTRRGGLDINPFRTNWPSDSTNNLRLSRQ